MNMMHRQRIGAAFSAADDYNQHARIQRLVAQELAARIAALPLPPRPRILEIGCGTGFLTEALIAQGISADWLITDISPDMIRRCRERIGEAADRRFAVLDGELGLPENPGSYDLICSSLALQWFDNPEQALSYTITWLRPGAHCLFTTLTSGSFTEWRTAHAIEGLSAGTLDFPDIAQVAKILPEMAQEPPRIARYVEHHDSALDFMRSLRAIGAHTARHQHAPLNPAQMRRVMRNFEEAGAAVSYEVASCHYTRPRSGTR